LKMKFKVNEEHTTVTLRVGLVLRSLTGTWSSVS
jgi:hypothetical protein